MNRRGFLAGLLGTGAVAAAAPTLALVPKPATPAVAPAPDHVLANDLERHVTLALSRVLSLTKIRPESYPVENARLGHTILITEPRPFVPYAVGPCARVRPLTLLRQSCRGVRSSPVHGPKWEDVAKAAGEIAGDILGDSRAGCRGLVFGHLPDVSEYGARDCKSLRLGDGAMRGAEFYSVLTDEFIIRFDVLYGWMNTPQSWQPYGGGNNLLLV